MVGDGNDCCGDGVGMGITGAGTVEDGDKYVSLCSSLIDLSPGVPKNLTKFCR